MAVGVAIRGGAESASMLCGLLLLLLMLLNGASNELDLGSGSLAAEAAMTDAQVHGAHVKVDAIDWRESVSVIVIVAHQLHLMSLVHIVVCIDVERG